MAVTSKVKRHDTQRQCFRFVCFDIVNALYSKLQSCYFNTFKGDFFSISLSLYFWDDETDHPEQVLKLCSGIIAYNDFANIVLPQSDYTDVVWDNL